MRGLANQLSDVSFIKTQLISNVQSLSLPVSANMKSAMFLMNGKLHWWFAKPFISVCGDISIFRNASKPVTILAWFKVQYKVKYWDFIVFQILMLQFKVLHNIDITIYQNVNNHRNIIILNSIYLKVSQIPMQLSFEFVWQAGFSIHNFYYYSAYVLHLFVLKLPENSNYNYTKFTINLCMVLWERLYGLYHLLWCIDVFWRVLCFHPLPLPCLLGLCMAPDNIWNINWHMSFFYRLVTTKFVRSLF